jgi:hypothetical protein
MLPPTLKTVNCTTLPAQLASHFEWISANSLSALQETMRILLDPMNAGHHSARKHIHDRPASFSRAFGLDRHVSTASTDRVVNAEASGECAATDQEQGRECECELSHCWMIQRAICREKLPQKGIAHNAVSGLSLQTC